MCKCGTGEETTDAFNCSGGNLQSEGRKGRREGKEGVEMFIRESHHTSENTQKNSVGLR